MKPIVKPTTKFVIKNRSIIPVKSKVSIIAVSKNSNTPVFKDKRLIQTDMIRNFLRDPKKLTTWIINSIDYIQHINIK